MGGLAPRAAALSATTEIRFSGPFFHAPPENRLVRDRHTRLAAAAILSRSAHRSRLPDLLLCNSGLLICGSGFKSLAAHPI